jgi:HK97 gp10 family phage protein
MEGIGKVDVGEAIKRGTQMVWREAGKTAPVNKDPLAPTRGDLRASIRMRALGGRYRYGGVVSTDVHYAPYVEFGTYKMASQPYLRPAFDKNARAISRLIRETVKLHNKNYVK